MAASKLAAISDDQAIFSEAGWLPLRASLRGRNVAATPGKNRLHASLCIPIADDVADTTNNVITDNTISLGNSLHNISFAVDSADTSDTTFTGDTAFAALYTEITCTTYTTAN